LSLALFIFNSANAQVDDTSDYNRSVVIGNIKPSPSSSTVNNVRIISAKTIEAQGAVSLKDVLNKELNVRIGNDNILGSSLSLQGISGQNVKILLDGIPITGRENGNIDLSQINLSNIERIEIIEGPLSVIYGTDALGGVINLVSKSIRLDSTQTAVGFGNAYYESIKQTNFGGGGIFRLKDVDFGANLNRNFFGGYNLDPNSRVMIWKPKQQVFGSFSILYQNERLKLRFKTDIFNEKIENRGLPVINHIEAYAYDEYYLTNRNINSLSIEYKTTENSYFNILSSFSFYQRDKVTYRKDLTKESYNMSIVPSPDANSTNSFLNFMSRGTYNNTKYDKFNYQIGYDINLNSAFGTKIEADKGHMNDYALFACAEYRPTKRISLKPGFRATYNTKYSAPFVPSAQLMYTSRNKNLIVRYAYGRGFRAPGLKELYLYFVDFNHNIIGNPYLKSEMSDNHNAAIKYRIKVKGKHLLTIDNSYFYNTIYNQIALVAVNPLALEYTYRNVDNFKSIGTNLNGSLVFKSWRFNLGGSYIGIYNNAFALVGKNKYMYTPEVRTQISYSKKNKNYAPTTFSVFHKFNGSTFGYALDEARNIINTYTESYHILDISVNQSFWDRKISFTLGLKNLLNVTNITATGTSNSFHSAGNNSMPVSVGRSIFTQINIKL
jgi:outer membrane receptor for ferrienterochelin and colicins